MKTPRWWQSRNALSLLLTPFSWLYRAGFALDRSCTTPRRAPLPVIAIGNVTAGGAGKTPTALAIAQLLQAAGHTPHFVSRGYKGSAQQVQQVTPANDWHIMGDEPLLLAQVAPTWVCPDRFAATDAAAKDGATLVIADDALQHHALAAQVNLLVIDGAYGIGNGALLPAGPLRETLTGALTRCHAVILIGDDRQKLSQHVTLPIFSATLEATGDVGYLREGKWLAFAGIARPQKFYDTLQAHGTTLAATRDFADHYAYSDADLEDLCAEADRLGAKLITTEKDAVKIPAAYRSRLQILPVRLYFSNAEKLLQYLTTLIFSSESTK